MRVTAVGAALIALLASVVPAQAQARTGCTWVPSDLPLPAGVTGGTVYAAGPNGYLAGAANRSGGVLVWHDRAVTRLDTPVDADLSVSAVNGNGDVVGFDSHTHSAFVHRNGTYQLLPGPAGERTEAVGINASGDIVGTVGDGGASSPSRVVLWQATQPGTYQIVAGSRAVGIDDAGRVVNDEGLVRAADGTTSTLAGYGGLLVELYQGGRILGRRWDDTKGLREWSITGPELRRFDMPVTGPMGINSKGTLATWYYKYGNRGNTLGVWQDGTFAGELGTRVNVYAVTEADELAGSRPVATGVPWGPATWTCV